MTARYMLDTNIVRGLLRGHPEISKRIVDAPMASLCISAITLGELHFGLARRHESQKLRIAVEAFLLRVSSLPWDDAVASRYGLLRSAMEAKGKPLAALDMLIAAHALEAKAVLVTNDGAFRHVLDLKTEDWTIRQQ
jgi:tRNA(fMet)-specific endonuclease VapC